MISIPQHQSTFSLICTSEYTQFYPIKSWSLNKCKLSFLRTRRREREASVGYVSRNCIKGVIASEIGNTNTKTKTDLLKAIIVTSKQNGDWPLSGVLDSMGELVGKTLALELLSNEQEKVTIKGIARKVSEKETEVQYEAFFEVPANFGDVGAIRVKNEQCDELFLKSIVLDGFIGGRTVHFTCDSWIQPAKNSEDSPVIQRVFFSDKSYLPSQTPVGLRRLREEELVQLRGNGQGERKSTDRVYDYDVYNDLGDPDSNIDLKRPVLGGSKQYPYPRRCRTGREPCHTDPSCEAKSSTFYVPRDEAFGGVKLTQFWSTIASSARGIPNSLLDILTDENIGFLSFDDIDNLFKEGYQLPPLRDEGLLSLLKSAIRWLTQAVDDSQNNLRFDTPEAFKRDQFFWLSDDEFGRETLAGVNPYSIQLVKACEWPLRSKLEPEEKSAITKEVIESQITGTIEKAIEDKKLFILDYHDLLLPYVSKVREINKGTTLYASRTIFYLTSQGTLKPLAIELTRPPMNGMKRWNQVFTIPARSSTDLWLWRLAKAHVLAHDSGFHQLVSHWLRTHCAVEPFVIATHRQLSAMHPIYRLLHPHLRYTMDINARARQSLINANGIIESAFFPNKYSMELSSVAYDQLWRFDLQALPNELIDRGMAVKDPNSPHGLKLTIEDFPFANDGLLIWDALKQWITEYVKHYYPNPRVVESDQELQAWWKEIRTVGHGDKAEEPWWPNLNTSEDLIDIITTIAWVASAYHAAVNFGQYTFAGYFPNRPTIARNKMPTEDPSPGEWEKFLKNPDQTLLENLPSQYQAASVILTLNLLSYHSPDEEYMGEHREPSWDEDPTIKAAFEKFKNKLKEIEGIIDSRNANSELKNRNGAGLVPYELMKPFSGPGVTTKGVPYSISI